MGYNLTVDGGIGNLTLNAINAANQMDLYNNFKSARQDYYDTLVTKNPKYSPFLNGWTNRVNKFENKPSLKNENINFIKPMKNLLYILFVMLIFSCKGEAQTFSFQGTWADSTSRTQFVLKLIQTDTVLTGNHYAVQLAGNRIDSSLDDANITINGIVNITLEEATVTFTSGYSGTSGTAKITKHSPTEIKWEIIQKPTDEYYIPNVAILKKE